MRSQGLAFVDNSKCAIGLRHGSLLLDSTLGFCDGTSFQTNTALQVCVFTSHASWRCKVFRFFDSDLYYRDQEVALP